MPSPSDCLFCRIVAGELPAAILIQDADVVAFLDLHPVNKGHLLIVPRAHHPTLADLPEALASAVARHVPALARALLRVTRAPGYHLVVNNGAVAGQTVHHVHWHLIPRFEGDAVHWPWPHQSYGEGEMEATRAALAAEVAGRARLNPAIDEAQDSL